MGVKATLVGSLVIDEKLWGLVACHHYAGPRHISPELRDVFAWFCEDIASVIDADQLRQARARDLDLAARRQALVGTIRAQDFRGLIRRGEGQEVMDVVGADDFALIINDSTELIGHTPDVAQVRELKARWLARAPAGTLFATSHLESELGLGVAVPGVAGALFVSVPHKPSVTMVWFRDERAHHVRWGGDPANAHTLEADGRISPRKSFAQFLQEVRGRSLPWTDAELASAHELGTLIEIDALRQRVQHRQAAHVVGLALALQMFEHRDHIGRFAGVDQRAHGGINQFVLVAVKVLVHQQVATLCVQIDADHVAILHQRQWATHRSFGRHLGNNQAFADQARQVSIGDQGDIRTQSCAVDGEHHFR